MVFQKLFGSPVDYLNMLHMLGSWYSNTILKAQEFRLKQPSLLSLNKICSATQIM